MNINLLVNVASRAWALPVLGALHDGVIARQSRLIAATGAGRAAFVQSLTHLIDLGLVERNPGHGHPLRPEFRLTTQGKPVAEAASRINKLTPFGEHDLLRRTWTVPVLASLSRPKHFGEVRADLGAITDRALAQSLQRIEAHDWISRRVNIHHRPPRPIYQSANEGLVIGQIVTGDLAAIHQ